MPFDLYVITDETLAGGIPHAEIARRAVRGGADAIQLRDKHMESRDLVQVGREILAHTRPAGALFLVNDRLDVALACGADGIHLGQDDIRPDVARQLSPPGFIIGVSAGSIEEAREAERAGADYVVLSPVFSTGSKADAGPGLGLAELARMKKAVRIPVLAIGGIGPSNVTDVIRAGADGVAVISAVVSAPDITEASRTMKALIVRAKGPGRR
ncbi:MAG: thiamine phosphate synthase [Methanomicrobiales archaeon]|nr:thiamine phosphate synthase [Methanomicrobiales archaeon]